MNDLEKQLIEIKSDIYHIKARQERFEKESADRQIKYEKSLEKLETSFNNGIEDIIKKFDKIEDESSYAKGFIKAVLTFAGLVAFTVSVILHFVK